MKGDLTSRLKNIPGFPQERIELLTERIESILSYQAKVGIFGKTGAGKSSLCNALFGEDVAEVSDVQACTRNPQEVFLNIAPGALSEQQQDAHRWLCTAFAPAVSPCLLLCVHSLHQASR